MKKVISNLFLGLSFGLMTPQSVAAGYNCEHTHVCEDDSANMLLLGGTFIGLSGLFFILAAYLRIKHGPTYYEQLCENEPVVTTTTTTGCPSFVPAYYENVSSGSPSSWSGTLYTSNECCVCFEPFTCVERIYLKPCGHDMCRACARKWCRTHGKGCSKCRSSVNSNLTFGVSL